MFKLDDSFLQTLGLGSLPVEEKNRLLQHIYETLEMRVGMRLAENMTELQLDEFESYIDRNDEAGALKWLETNFPNYRDVVSEELDKLKAEISVSAPQILAGARTGGGAAPTAMTPPAMMPSTSPTTPPTTATPSPTNQPSDGYGQSNFGQGPSTPTQNPQQYTPPNSSQPVNQPTSMPPEPSWPVEQTLTPPPLPPSNNFSSSVGQSMTAPDQPLETTAGTTNPMPEPLPPSTMPPNQEPTPDLTPMTPPMPPTPSTTSAPLPPPGPMPSQSGVSSETVPPVQPWQPAPPK